MEDSLALILDQMSTRYAVSLYAISVPSLSIEYETSHFTWNSERASHIEALPDSALAHFNNGGIIRIWVRCRFNITPSDSIPGRLTISRSDRSENDCSVEFLPVGYALSDNAFERFLKLFESHPTFPTPTFDTEVVCRIGIQASDQNEYLGSINSAKCESVSDVILMYEKWKRDCE